MRLAVACPNPLAAQAALLTGQAGGTAVDAAVASMLVTCVSEPGVVSLAGGAFVAVRPPGGPAVTVDAYVDMPGRRLPPSARGAGLREITTAYGGGTTMTIGAGSVAVPGLLSGLQEAHRRYGRLPWRDVVAPAVETAREGFPLGRAGDHYLGHVREVLFGHDPQTRAAVHHPDGRPVTAGDRMVIPHLAGFLELVAERGADALLRGDVAQALVERLADDGGLVTRADLEAYTPVLRPATSVTIGPAGGRWQVDTNPPPAIGGVVLAAILLLLDDAARESGSPGPEALVRVLRAVLGHRAGVLDLARDREAAGHALLDAVTRAGGSWAAAPSTAHVSVAAADGSVCAITASSGYGSGITVPGTGVWLNNCLGEHELNRAGAHALPAGSRLASNMAPTVAVREDGAVLAIGSPGADRITTALAQVMTAIAHDGAALDDAVARPRLHLAVAEDGTQVLHHEADLPAWARDLLPAGPVRREHPAASMYFGGVGAALLTPDGALHAAADPRRDGAAVVG